MEKILNIPDFFRIFAVDLITNKKKSYNYVNC